MHPAAAGRNDMPFDRDIRVVPSNIMFRAASHGSVRMLLCFTAVIFFKFHFRQPNLGRLSTDLAEIWHADQKLV